MIDLFGFLGLASILFFIFTRAVSSANQSKLEPVCMNSDILISNNYEQGTIQISDDSVILRHSIISDKVISFRDIKTIRSTFLFLQRVEIDYFKGTDARSLKFETYQSREIVQLVQSCMYLARQKKELGNMEQDLESNI